MGGNRENVQRIINDLRKQRLAAFEANQHNRRAQLVVLTDKGKQTFDAAMRLQAPWINSVSNGLMMKDIQTFHRIIIALRQKLEVNESEERSHFTDSRLLLPNPGYFRVVRHPTTIAGWTLPNLR